MRNERHGGPRGDGFRCCTGWPGCCSTSHPEITKPGNWPVSRYKDRWCKCRQHRLWGNLQGSHVTRTTHVIGNRATKPIVPVANEKDSDRSKRADVHVDCDVA